MIYLYNTYINENAFEEVNKVLQSTFLSEGKLVKEFEEKLSSVLGSINPVAVNSGTSALHLALVLADIKEGDEVICPAQTFVATALAVLYQKAVPIFADVQYETGNIDPESIKSKITEKTKAIIPVHWGGYPCDMDEIISIANNYNLIVIEDAAHAPGAIYKGRAIGTISDYTCFSFQAIKHITTGDGGAVCCKNIDKAKEAITRRWFGIDRANSKPSILGEREYDLSLLGYKYHLNDYSATLGIANLENFNERLKRRRAIANLYKQKLGKVPGIKLFEEKTDRLSAYWLFGMHVENRENFIRALKSKNIMTSVVHQRIDRNIVFGGLKEDLINQAKFDQTKIHIPIHDGLMDNDIDKIINTIKKGW